MPLDSISIDGFGPLLVEQPASVAELCNLVRRAAAADQAIYPVGGRTMLDLGFPPTKPGIAVDLTRLDQVIDYPARDMTITVQAGITISRLQEILAKEHQRLPVDVPNPERATLGGALATNASGPRRLGFGTLRDYVIGISAVNDEGNEIKAGGRVVKNVAGYDLCKLLIGSLGTLGIITQVTLKVRPRPEAQAMVVAGSPMKSLADLLDRIHGSATRPVCIELSAPSPIKADCQVMIGFEETTEAVEWQIDRLQKELHPDYPCLVRHGGDAERDCGLLAAGINSPASPMSLKLTVLPSRLPDFLGMVREISPGSLQAQAGSGVVFGHAADGLTLDQAKTMLTRLQEIATAAQGNVVVTRCSPAWKKELPVWGAPRGDIALMRAVKDRLDPRRLFNPGRFIDGI